ncbi:MAG: hypothetical protein D3922_07970, partial [Candidatus Electrothrix sp. AR1]|nr:hypothetical protein [Candidatus Electrothrix sp. AR1]
MIIEKSYEKINMIRAKGKTISILIIIFLSVGSAKAQEADLEKLFNKRNVKGTLLISSLDGKTEYFHNKARTEKRFVPASTFKIP